MGRGRVRCLDALQRKRGMAHSVFSRTDRVTVAVRSMRAIPPPPALPVQVNVAASAPLTLGVCENYTLSVPSGGVAILTAPTQWGALRGLESFSQLVAWSQNGQSNVYAIANTPITINDWPRFPWRGEEGGGGKGGLLVDCQALSFPQLSDTCSLRPLHRFPD